MKPKKLIDELKRIARAHGGTLTPEIVLQSAKAQSSPLHNRFTWDNTEAAKRWRIYEARQLIKVCVEVDTCGMGITSRVFVSLSTERDTEGQSTFRLLSGVLLERNQREQLLIDAQAEMRAFISKFETLKELAAVIKPMRRFISKQHKNRKKT